MLLNKLVRYMEATGYEVFKGNKQFNLIAIEGCNPDTFELNNDEPDKYNDCFNVIEFVNNEAVLKFSVYCTTEPGSWYTENPMSDKGAARIKFGQYKSWKIGYHKNQYALVQEAPITVFRDLNKDGYRTGDKEDTGIFGVDIHTTNSDNNETNSIGRWSAGCIVVANKSSFSNIMQLLQTDSRYTADNDFLFTLTVIDGEDFNNFTC